MDTHASGSEPAADSPALLPTVLASAGVSRGDVARIVPLAGGTYNTVLRVVLRDGRDWVLKVPPRRDTPGLRYERDLLRSEAAFCAAARTVGDARVPEVVRADLVPGPAGGPWLLTTTRPGTPWSDLAEDITAPERSRMREELGRVVARLHTATGPGFGYPSGALGPLAPTWREAFTAMTDAVLDDAARYGVRLPQPPERLRNRLAAVAGVLDDVERPAAVHFDLWNGNLLVHGPPGERAVGGVVDGERMFWGDPVADFVSLALLGDIETDRDFLRGYAAAGGVARFDASVRTRLAMYRCYLYLIMLVETVPRAASPEQCARVREQVAPCLLAALDALEATP
ncbi:phosphotransferase family protein [Streptomyces sp. NPDC056568]|uniref:phosphotransferase family protein n=1 Tax=Streptomyces sp. NPDC056568 TaxID=3345866 RepID=UPI00369D378F